MWGCGNFVFIVISFQSSWVSRFQIETIFPYPVKVGGGTTPAIGPVKNIIFHVYTQTVFNVYGASKKFYGIIGTVKNSYVFYRCTTAHGIESKSVEFHLFFNLISTDRR